MKKFFQNVIKCLAVFSLALIVGLPFQTVSPAIASAEYLETENLYDDTFVIDDLGEAYVSKFPEEASAAPKINSFVEYCYSDTEFTRNANYGLYLYLYNPSRTEYSEKAGASVINMATEWNAFGEPTKYENLPLKMCGYTLGKYDKLFYKFRVKNVAKILENAVKLDEAGKERRYDVAGIQLKAVSDTGAKDYSVGKTFFYKGYAKGFGAGAESTSTLESRYEERETLSLEVHSTYYRPEGHNEIDNYTQDSLHSVYFSVPNEMIEKYGEMVAVHATWLEAVLKPALVTGNQEAYNAIAQQLGKTPAELEYAYLGAAALLYTSNASPYYKGDLGYNMPSDNGSTLGTIYVTNEIARIVSELYMLFPPETFERNSADEFILDSELIKTQMKASAAKFGGELIEGAEGAYSKKIFEKIADTYTDTTIRADTMQELLVQEISGNMWEALFGTADTTETKKSVKSIQKVLESDFTGDKSVDCNNLFISEADYDAFKNYYNQKKDTDQVYLFRYRVSDYFSQEATLFERSDDPINEAFGSNSWNKLDTNAYFFKMSVDLNFEVIDVTFKKGEKETVIPVVMSPIDIVHDATPPLNTTTDPVKWGGCSGSIWNTIKNVLIGCIVIFVIVAVIKLIIKAFNRRQKVTIKVKSANEKKRRKKRKRRG